VPMPASMPQQSQQPQQQAAQEETITEDQAKRILALEKEVAANPNNADAWTQLGNLYFDTNNFESAIRSYKKSLALKPNNANIQTDLGVMYRRAGQPQEAIKAFEKAVQIDPKHEIARFNTGIVFLHDLNDREGALKAWQDLVDINPAAMTPGGKPLAEMIKALSASPK
jgi:cytochrome c-type biogenesis protein CcmH/NrfG